MGLCSIGTKTFADPIDDAVDEVVDAGLVFLDFLALTFGQQRTDLVVQFEAFNREIGLNDRQFGCGRPDGSLAGLGGLNGLAHSHSGLVQLLYERGQCLFVGTQNAFDLAELVGSQAESLFGTFEPWPATGALAERGFGRLRLKGPSANAERGGDCHHEQTGFLHTLSYTQGGVGMLQGEVSGCVVSGFVFKLCPTFNL